jgi:hypothetical protein
MPFTPRDRRMQAIEHGLQALDYLAPDHPDRLFLAIGLSDAFSHAIGLVSDDMLAARYNVMRQENARRTKSREDILARIHGTPRPVQEWDSRLHNYVWQTIEWVLWYEPETAARCSATELQNVRRQAGELPFLS